MVMKSWKMLVTADIHMSNKLPYAIPGENDLTDRFSDQLNVFKQINNIAEKKSVDAVFILGDLFDKSLVDAVTLTHTVEAIMSIETDVMILPGNHDANSIRGGRFVVEAFSRMGKSNVQVIGDKKCESIFVDIGGNNLSFWPIAFKPITETKEEIELIKGAMSNKSSNVLLMHNSIVGATNLGWKCDSGLEAKELDDFDLILSGHFHEYQEFDGGMYVGSPMHHDFEDVGRENFVWLFEFFEDGSFKKKAIPIESPKFHKFQYGEEELKGFSSGDYVRLEVSATHAKWVAMKAEVERVCGDLKSKGVNATYINKFTYQHKTRLGDEKFDDFTLESALVHYVKSDEVEVDGLNKKKLLEIGKDILAEAKR